MSCANENRTGKNAAHRRVAEWGRGRLETTEKTTLEKKEIKMNMQDIRNEVVGYIRNSGEDIKDYNVDMCADYLYDVLHLDGERAYRAEFEWAVFNFRIAE